MIKRILVFVLIMILLTMQIDIKSYAVVNEYGEESNKDTITQKETVKEKKKEITKTDTPKPNFMDNDLLVNWSLPENMDVSKNSFKYDSNSKKSEPLGSKDNFYPSILPAYTGEQKIAFDKLNFGLKSSNLNASFFTSGEKVYEVATMRGAFVKRGLIWGDETGVWAQPIKMLDGVLLEVEDKNGKWQLNDSKNFTNKLSAAEMLFRKNGLKVTRTDFAPESEYAFYYIVNFKNELKTNKSFTFRFTFQENIRPIWHKPWTTNYGQDVININKNGYFTAYDVEMNKLASTAQVVKPYNEPSDEFEKRLSLFNDKRSDIGKVQIAFGSSNKPQKQYTNTLNKYRNRGILEYTITLKPGENKRLEFVSVMYDSKKIQNDSSKKNIKTVDDYFNQVKGKSQIYLDEKNKIYKKSIIDGVTVDLPDKNIQNAFYSAKYNIQALTMDLRPFYQERNIMTSPERAYQKSFGIDSMYASIGAANAGFTDIVKDTINNFYYFSNIIDFKGIAVDISQFGTLESSGGRAQEGTQYIGTVWEYLRKTGDLAMLKKVYPGLVKIHDSYRQRDKNNNFWPEGMTFPGLSDEVEKIAGNDYEMISAAVRMWWSTKAIGEMSKVLGYNAEYLKYSKLADEMKDKFNREWWNGKSQSWYLGLSNLLQGEKGVFLDYRSWPINYPQKYLIADEDKGKINIDSVWNSDAVDSRKSYIGGAPTVWQNSNYAIGCFNYGKGDFGIQLLKSSAANPTQLGSKMLGAFSTINPDPSNDPQSNANKIMYNWCAGPYLESVINGLFGIQTDAFSKTLQFNPYVPEGWKNMSLKGYKMGGNVFDFVLKDGKWEVHMVSGKDNVRLITNVKGLIIQPLK